MRPWRPRDRHRQGPDSVPIFDEPGEPLQRRGVTPFPGLYFVGLPWLHNLRCSFLFSLGENVATSPRRSPWARGLTTFRPGS
jgi:hypothetical protein